MTEINNADLSGIKYDAYGLVPVIAQDSGDPGAVVFDALSAARATHRSI